MSETFSYVWDREQNILAKSMITKYLSVIGWME